MLVTTDSAIIQNPPVKKSKISTPGPSSIDDFRDKLLEDADLSIVRPLSAHVVSLFHQDKISSPHFLQLLRNGEIVWQSPTSPWRTLLRLNPHICAKTIPDDQDLTEYSALEYLAAHKPDFPAPKPLGILRLQNSYFMFMTYLRWNYPEISLEGSAIKFERSYPSTAE